MMRILFAVFYRLIQCLSDVFGYEQCYCVTEYDLDFFENVLLPTICFAFEQELLIYVKDCSY